MSKVPKQRETLPPPDLAPPTGVPELRLPLLGLGGSAESQNILLNNVNLVGGGGGGGGGIFRGFVCVRACVYRALYIV